MGFSGKMIGDPVMLDNPSRSIIDAAAALAGSILHGVLLLLSAAYKSDGEDVVRYSARLRCYSRMAAAASLEGIE